MKKKTITALIAFTLFVGCYLFYRNTKITCHVEKNVDYQSVSIHKGLFIEEPVHDFQLPKNAQGTSYLITTDTFIPVLALYNRNPVQTFIFTYLYHNNSLASWIEIIETDRNFPVQFDSQWKVLEKNDNASLSFSETDEYKYYQILLDTKEIRISLQKRSHSDEIEDEFYQCIIDNFQRLSQSS